MQEIIWFQAYIYNIVLEDIKSRQKWEVTYHFHGNVKSPHKHAKSLEWLRMFVEWLSMSIEMISHLMSHGHAKPLNEHAKPLK